MSSRPLRFLALAGLLAVGAVSFSEVFRYHLNQVPAANYEARDDALITLSHARNLVEYGFIGVSPSGERIEGFSAPLQFAVAAVVYAVTPFEYATFFHWQTTLGTIVLGMVLAGLLAFPGSLKGASWRYLFAVVAIVGSAEILASSRAFLLWHASGMENVYKVVGLTALIWMLDRMLRTDRVIWAAAALVPAAALSRLDAIVPVSFLLAAFAGLWWLRHRNARAITFVAVSLMPWVLAMAWRYWYFGQWDPSTAAAQRISVDARLAALLHNPSAVMADCRAWLANVGGSLHALQLVWLPVAVFFAGRSRTALNRAVLLFTGVLACVAQYVLFGAVRLDVARTVTELALYATIAAPFVLLSRDDFRARDFIAGACIVGCSVALAARRPPDRTEIGWGTAWFESNADQLATIARDQAIPRPVVANADLGAMSWQKRANVLDLGLLGSTLLPKLEHPGAYVAAIAKPDLMEVHGAWSCLYRDLFASPEFRDEYQALSADRTPWFDQNCPDVPLAANGMWIRRAVMKDSSSPERLFMDTFGRTLDEKSLDVELSRCLPDSSPHPCAYVGRTLFRFVPELKRAGRYDAIARRLAGDGRLRIEHAYFTSSTDPHWWRAVIAAVQPLSVSPDRLSFFARQDGTRSSHATIRIEDPLGLGWHAAAPVGLFDLKPDRGTGSATLRLVARALPAATDQTVDIPITAGTDTRAARTVAVRFKAMSAPAFGPPAGLIDAPADPVRLEDAPVIFQGWAVDPFDLQSVFVTYEDARGRTGELGEARRAGARPDVAALFPGAHDLLNAGWTFALTPDALRGLPRPVVLHFQARGATQIVELGTRHVVAR